MGMQGPEIPEPVFFNLEYIFFLFYRAFGGFFEYLFSPEFISDLKVILTVIAILLITAIIYCLIRLWEIEREKEREKAKRISDAPVLAAKAPGQKSSFSQLWQDIRNRGFSDDANAWRLAIIEADIYLDRFLLERGYMGETLSDRLKQLTPEKLRSIDRAWEAHKVRNRIAHEGSTFTLTYPEARRTITNFEAVFKELGALVG